MRTRLTESQSVAMAWVLVALVACVELSSRMLHTALSSDAPAALSLSICTNICGTHMRIVFWLERGWESAGEQMSLRCDDARLFRVVPLAARTQTE